MTLGLSQADAYAKAYWWMENDPITNTPYGVDSGLREYLQIDVFNTLYVAIPQYPDFFKTDINTLFKHSLFLSDTYSLTKWGIDSALASDFITLQNKILTAYEFYFRYQIVKSIKNWPANYSSTPWQVMVYSGSQQIQKNICELYDKKTWEGFDKNWENAGGLEAPPNKGQDELYHVWRNAADIINTYVTAKNYNSLVEAERNDIGKKIKETFVQVFISAVTLGLAQGLASEFVKALKPAALPTTNELILAQPIEESGLQKVGETVAEVGVDIITSSTPDTSKALLSGLQTAAETNKSREGSTTKVNIGEAISDIIESGKEQLTKVGQDLLKLGSVKIGETVGDALASVPGIISGDQPKDGAPPTTNNVTENIKSFFAGLFSTKSGQAIQDAAIAQTAADKFKLFIQSPITWIVAAALVFGLFFIKVRR